MRIPSPKARSDLMIAAGGLLLTVAAGLWHVRAGVAVAGVVLTVAGLFLVDVDRSGGR